MKRFLLLLLPFLMQFPSFGQDTTVVQTLEFSDITKRRGWYVFPPEGDQYRQILMYYTLKCDAQTTQDQYPCGEWDYTTFTHLYQHENIGAPRYGINGLYPDTVFFYNQESYNYFQGFDQFIVYDNTISENDYTVGTAAQNPNNQVLQSQLKSSKAQYLFTASELISAGVSPGDIHKLRLDISALGSDLNNLEIRMKNSQLSELTSESFEMSGLQSVYHFNTQISSTGIFTVNFTQPFEWDGISNLVVEFSFQNAQSGTNYEVLSEITGFNSGVVSNADDSYLEFSKPDYVQIPAEAFADLDSSVTVSFWIYGDPNIQPNNNYAFEARDANNNRVIGSHLPWGNSRVYWDAGNSGTGSYDRIDQLADPSSYEGQWNHWAFTKDVATGEMKIWLNNQLFHSGTNMTRTMAGITNFRIGANATQPGAYDGFMDEFRIWNHALDSAEIVAWMHKKIDPSHPEYEHLILAYDFNEINGLEVVDYGPNGHHGTRMGAPNQVQYAGTANQLDLSMTMSRPKISFVQGEYVSHLDSVMVLDSVSTGQLTILEEQTAIVMEQTGVTFTPSDTISTFSGNFWTFTYNWQGDKIDSTWVSNTGFYVNEFETITHQIQNYVTPYGIGLNLGPNGFRWVYDVTDYVSLFHDTVDISAGNQQELIDLKFVMIEGTPPRDIIDFQTIWRGDYSHANIANDVSMPAVDVVLNPNASEYTVRTRTTGHWFGGFENCAEFCPKLHHVKIDGTKRFEWLNWTECADNPVMDQGGTWIYDRAGWCPGAFADTYNHDITPYVNPGDLVSIDYGMEVTPGGMEGNYRTTVQLFSYGSPNHTLDAAITGVIAPNDWEFYGKHNPICSQPVVVIRNDGSDTLKSATIAYNVEGGAVVNYEWTGALAFGQEEVVKLHPCEAWFWASGAGTNRFEVRILNPNGGQDQYADNDAYFTNFENPDELPEHFYVWVQTNGAAHETSYQLRDWTGQVVFERDNMANNTTYRDTFLLDPGCYTLHFVDSDGDGIQFFANNDGTGFLRWKQVGVGLIYTFENGFGNDLTYHFTIGGELGVEEQAGPYVHVFPNPSDAIFNIEAEGFNGDMSIKAYSSIGKLVAEETIHGVVGGTNAKIDLSGLPAGIYLLHLSDGNNAKTLKVIKQ